MNGETELRVKRKRQRIVELGQLLDMGAEAAITKEDRGRVQEWTDRMHFRMDKNKEESVERELDIKIECMAEILKVMQGKHADAETADHAS